MGMRINPYRQFCGADDVWRYAKKHPFIYCPQHGLLSGGVVEPDFRCPFDFDSGLGTVFQEKKIKFRAWKILNSSF